MMAKLSTLLAELRRREAALLAAENRVLCSRLALQKLFTELDVSARAAWETEPPRPPGPARLLVTTET